MIHISTSCCFNVSMLVAPKSDAHTSEERFGLLADANIFISKYPNDSEDTAINANIASPFTPFFLLKANKNKLHSKVKGKVSIILFDKLAIVAILVIKKATCDKLSPIKLYDFSTSTTPINEEHNAINMPTTIAYCTKGNRK